MDTGITPLNCAMFLLQQGAVLEPEEQDSCARPIPAAQGRDCDSLVFMMLTVFLLVMWMCVLVFLLPLIVLIFFFAYQWGELICFALWPCWSPKWQDYWRWRLMVSKGLELVWYFWFTTVVSIQELYVLLAKGWLHTDKKSINLLNRRYLCMPGHSGFFQRSCTPASLVERKKEILFQTLLHQRHLEFSLRNGCMLSTRAVAKFVIWVCSWTSDLNLSSGGGVEDHESVGCF